VVGQINTKTEANFAAFLEFALKGAAWSASEREIPVAVYERAGHKHTHVRPIVRNSRLKWISLFALGIHSRKKRGEGKMLRLVTLLFLAIAFDGRRTLGDRSGAEGSAYRGDVRTNCFKYVILAEFFVCGIAVVFLGLS